LPYQRAMANTTAPTAIQMRAKVEDFTGRRPIVRTGRTA
jgi:hypothetical protein